MADWFIHGSDSGLNDQAGWVPGKGFMDPGAEPGMTSCGGLGGNYEGLGCIRLPFVL